MFAFVFLSLSPRYNKSRHTILHQSLDLYRWPDRWLLGCLVGWMDRWIDGRISDSRCECEFLVDGMSSIEMELNQTVSIFNT